MSGLPELIFFGIDWVSFSIDFLEFYALYIAISLSLNLEFGYTGIPNFGKVLFIAGGAAFGGAVAGRLASYILNIGTNEDFITFNARIITQVNNRIINDPILAAELVVIALLVAALIGGLLGFLASYPALRLREDYLGMLLLGAAQFFNVVLRTYTPLIGGSQPIFVPDPYYYWSTLGSGVRDIIALIVMAAFAIAVYVFIERVVRSPMGRTLRAIRDNEDAAAALGKDNATMRRNVLIVASAIAAMAGALYSFYVGSVEYDTWTRFAWTFWPFLIVIIGGVGNNTGILAGAFFFTLILRGLEQVQPYLQPYVFFNVNWLQDLLLAALLILVLYIRPEGIIREKSSHTLNKGALGKIAGLKEGEHEKMGDIGRLAKAIERVTSRFRQRTSLAPDAKADSSEKTR
jgi:branched-chain amino acid transport system permease protein